MIAQHSAIKMLHSRVKLILSYIKAVESGALPENSAILREAYALSQRLPVIQSSTFKEEYYTVIERSVTQSCSNSLFFQFNVLNIFDLIFFCVSLAIK